MGVDMKKLMLMVVLVLGIGSVCTGNIGATPVTWSIVDLEDWGRTYAYDTFGPNGVDDGGAGDDAGTYTSTNTQGPFTNWGGFTPATDDIAIGTKFSSGVLGIGAPHADGKEDSWGVAQVDQIQDANTSAILWDKDALGATYELTIMYDGFDDNYLIDPNLVGKTNILSKGGVVNIYKDFAKDYIAGMNTGLAGRTGQSSFTGATEGELVLSLIPTARPLDLSLDTLFNFHTNNGSGEIFLDVVGGSWLSLYNTNTLQFGSDFHMVFSANDDGNPNLLVSGAGVADANIVPEPTTVALLGIGLLGMIGIASRKRVKAGKNK